MYEHEAQRHLGKGLDALMTALASWNGGVIVISHDERFITSVSNEVGRPKLSDYRSTPNLTNSASFGCVVMAQSISTRVTFRLTRSVFLG